MKKIIFHLLAIFFASPAFAQYAQINLQGKILDSFLQNGITDCQVTLMRADSTIVDSEPKVYNIGNDNLHFTTIFDFFIPNQPGDYLVHVFFVAGGVCAAGKNDGHCECGGKRAADKYFTFH